MISDASSGVAVLRGSEAICPTPGLSVRALASFLSIKEEHLQKRKDLVSPWHHVCFVQSMIEGKEDRGQGMSSVGL
jgi:hypothetical protein